MTHAFSRLLLATEHGGFDAGAEALALALARRCGLPLAAVLPVVSNPEFEAVAPQLAARADAEAATRRQSLQALAQAAGVALQVRMRHGAEPFAEIVDEARQCGADLLIIRRRGKRGLLANLLVGEMVSKVLAHAPCSVLVAPPGAGLWSRQVLVGIDPLAPDAALLDEAAAVAAEFALPLFLLSVAASRDTQDATRQALDRALEQARGHGIPVQGEVRVGRAHEELLAAAKAHGADLLVLGRHGGNALGRAWIGGVAQKVIGLAECPVLVHSKPQPVATA